MFDYLNDYNTKVGDPVVKQETWILRNADFFQRFASFPEIPRDWYGRCDQIRFTRKYSYAYGNGALSLTHYLLDYRIGY